MLGFLVVFDKETLTASSVFVIYRPCISRPMLSFLQYGFFTMRDAHSTADCYSHEICTLEFILTSTGCAKWITLNVCNQTMRLRIRFPISTANKWRWAYKFRTYTSTILKRPLTEGTSQTIAIGWVGDINSWNACNAWLWSFELQNFVELGQQLQRR